jgi:hypothetical protein
MAGLVQVLDQDLLGAWRCLLLPGAQQQVEAAAAAASQAIVVDHFDCVLGKSTPLVWSCAAYWHHGPTDTLQPRASGWMMQWGGGCFQQTLCVVNAEGLVLRNSKTWYVILTANNI